MKVLLIDNSKASACEFTRLLELRLKSLVNFVICCSTLEETIENIEKYSFDAAILSGSSLNLSQPNRIHYIRKSIATVLRLNIPILGICFGMQLIATLYGGTVKRFNKAIKGEHKIYVEEGSVLLNGECKNIYVTLSHQDYVSEIPSDFKKFSQNGDSIQIFESLKFLRFGIQFHPEKRVSKENICVLCNFFRFVLERNNIPVSLSDSDWIEIIHAVYRKRLSYVEKTYNISRDDILKIWKHHIDIWGGALLLS